MRGLTLIELLAMIVIVMILAALILPNFRHRGESARRSTCASNLGQIGKALILYQDVPAYGSFPTDTIGARGNPMPSLGILYRDYLSDYRVFSCPKNPTLKELATLGETVGDNGSKSPLKASMSHYGYDSGNKGTDFKPHTSNDTLAVVVADFTLPGRNSYNHGPQVGQNVLLGAGSVECRETIANQVAEKVVDSDITSDGGIKDPNWLNMESYISQ